MKIRLEKKVGNPLSKKEIVFEVSEIDTVEDLDAVIKRFNLHV